MSGARASSLGRAARVVAGALLVLAGLVGRASSAPPEKPIQPGSYITSPAGCTLNFVFKDARERLYVGTAGHCTGSIGQSVKNDSGTFGTVVFRSFAGVGLDDFALVAIDPGHYDEVEPSMRGWSGPTGFTRYQETGNGEVIFEYGYGLGFGETALTRPRAGVMTGDNYLYWRGEIPIIYGDSGGPILHMSGKALGLVSGVLNGIMTGTTIERALELMAREGIDVQIVTAPFQLP